MGVMSPSTPTARTAASAADLLVPDLDRRLYAFAVDRMIAWSINMAVAFVCTRYLLSQGHVVAGILVIAGTVLLVGMAFALLVGATGVTPGKSLWGLRLVDIGTGRPIGAGPATVRTLVLGLAAVPFGFGLAALAWTAVADTSRLRRGWHDRLVSSVVIDTRPPPVVEEVEDAGPRHVVNLTAMRLAPTRRTPEPVGPAAGPARAPGRPKHAATRPPDEQSDHPGGSAPGWGLAFDSGERVVVDTLVLIGRRPEPRRGEQGARLVALPSADLSVSQTHAQVVVAADGALVVTDRGSSNGSTLVRQGMPRPLTPGRPTTLLEGDVVAVGDRTLTVHRVG